MRSAKTPPSSEYSAGAAILNLPLEVQHAIFYTDNEVYFKWPLLCKQAAVTSRFDNSLNKHGKFRQWLKKGRLWERHEYIVENNKKTRHLQGVASKRALGAYIPLQRR
mmetsp:Transcript_28308/g.31454  ORF Transcript_28308/g.31454 Transcript_28308/m.31454 type:complete len:108 (-) Transcript_28308:384-707(-)